MGIEFYPITMGVVVESPYVGPSRRRALRTFSTAIATLLFAVAILGPVLSGAPAPLVDLQISINPDEQDAFVSPGQDDVLIFDVAFSVDQPSWMRSDVEIHASMDTGWNIELATVRFVTSGQAMYSFPLTVTVPYDANADVVGHLSVTAVYDPLGPSETSADTNANITVRPYCDSCLRIHPNVVKLWPGNSITLEGKAMNNGNANYTFRLSVDSNEPKIEAEVSPSKLRIDAGASRTFDLEISVLEGISPDHHSIIVEMRSEPEGGERPLVVTEEVVVDTNPVEAVLRVDPVRAPPGMDVTFDASDSVLGMSSGRFLYDFGDGINSGWVTDDVVIHAYAREGNFTARLTVEGEGGVRSTNDASVLVRVTNEGFRPKAEITSISPNPALQGIEVTLTGRATPVPGANIVVQQWSSSIDGALGNGPLLVRTSLSKGTHTIEFKVQDERGTWSDPATTRLEVLPSREEWVIQITQPTKGARLEGETVKVRGTADCAGIHVERVEVRVDGGPWAVADGTCQWTFDLDLAELEDGEHTIEVRVRASGFWSNPAAVSVETGNANPLGLPSDGFTWQTGVLVVFLVVVVVALIWRARRRSTVPGL